ncbi:MAG: hypothetical protein Q7L19_04660 [Pseudohongiella sp.]|nr:hypothetical protein [Pseudohongiella sp.]
MVQSKFQKGLAVLCLAAAISALVSTQVQSATPQVRGQWAAAMGESSLRRFYSAGGDMGEIVNRVVSYQTANRVWQSQQGRPGAPSPADMRSRTDSWAAQNDSLIPIADSLERPLFARVMVRFAGREEEGLIRSRSDRLDLGLLYAPTSGSYIGVGLAAEESSSDVLYADGRARGQTFGPRFDAGLVFNSTWSAGIRYDYLMYRGDSEVNVQTPGGRLNITRDSEYTRQYMQASLMARITKAQLSWLPEGSVLRWSNGLQMIQNHHERAINSLGQVATEPFGRTEHLSVLRSGFNYSQNITQNGLWSAFAEIALDYEIDTNMAFPIDDRAGMVYSAALVRQLARGKRVQILVDRFQHANNDRSRNSVTLIGVIDF